MISDEQIGFRGDELTKDVFDRSPRLKKGRYRFTFIPDDFPPFDLAEIEGQFGLVDDSGDLKSYKIDKLIYNFQENLFIVDLTIIDNPPPAVLVWYAVLGLIAAIAGVTIYGILVKVETIPNSWLKNPLVWLVVLGLFLPKIWSVVKQARK